MIGNLLWFEFQGHKGQKGHYDRQKLQIAILQLYESKFGLPTLLMLNINALHQIQNGINKNDNFRGQMCLKSLKYSQNQKMVEI